MDSLIENYESRWFLCEYCNIGVNQTREQQVEVYQVRVRWCYVFFILCIFVRLVDWEIDSSKEDLIVQTHWLVFDPNHWWVRKFRLKLKAGDKVVTWIFAGKKVLGLTFWNWDFIFIGGARCLVQFRKGLKFCKFCSNCFDIC